MSRATPQRSSTGKKHTEMSKSSPAPSASPAARPGSSTPARPTTLSAKQSSSSTPRNRARPPTQRSFSTPLSRSMSVRVSKKERRWSERQADPKSPSTTYTDDYQSPKEISYKISSLNLEMSGTAASSLESESPTTYRESFRWPNGRRPPRSWFSNPITGGSFDQGDQSSGGRNGSTKPSVTFTVCSTDNTSKGAKVKASLSSSKTTDAGNGQQHNTVSGPSPETVSTSFSERPPRRSVVKKADLLPAKKTGSGNPHSVTSSDNRPSSASSNEDNSSSVKQVTGRETLLKPANGSEVKCNSRPISANNSSQVLTNGTGPVSLGASQPSHNKSASGNTGANASSSSERAVTTPRRTRAYQLQSSSNAGSPFVYGSDSGSWI